MPMHGVFAGDTLITQWVDSGSAEDNRDQLERYGGYDNLDVTEVCECGEEHRADDCPEQQDVELLVRVVQGLERL